MLIFLNVFIYFFVQQAWFRQKAEVRIFPHDKMADVNMTWEIRLVIADFEAPGK